MDPFKKKMFLLLWLLLNVTIRIINKIVPGPCWHVIPTVMCLLSQKLMHLNSVEEKKKELTDRIEQFSLTRDKLIFLEKYNIICKILAFYF